jgi:hypothetical protein
MQEALRRKLAWIITLTTAGCLHAATQAPVPLMLPAFETVPGLVVAAN